MERNEEDFFLFISSIENKKNSLILTGKSCDKTILERHYLKSSLSVDY
jgi:hypothetical protein